MGKEYRHLKCSGCPKKLRILISEKNFGKKVEITCPICQTKTRTTIPKPAAQKEPFRHHSSKSPFEDILDLFGKPKR